MFIYGKIFFFRCTRYFAVLIGNVIRFFRGNKNINLKDIKKIIFNRKDRIGDAVVSKPFIILFSKYVKEELKLDIEIEVECSKYNEFIFKEGNGENYYKIVSSNEEVSNTGISILGLIIQQFKNLKFKKNNQYKKNIIYVDLVGNPNHINQKKNNLNYYFIGGNLFLNNSLLDYSLPENYVSGVKINLIQSYINLVSGCFKLDKFDEYVNKNIEEFYSDYNYSENKKGILVFTGNKEYRNLDIKTWIKIINNISKKYKERKVIVMDDNSNIVFNKLKIERFSNNVEIKENKFSLCEFKEFARNFELLIGIDGGGFNYIRTCTDSITIYTIGNYNVRSIFTGKNMYNTTRLGYNRTKARVTTNGKIFGYLFKKSFLLPSYDQKILSKYFEDIVLL